MKKILILILITNSTIIKNLELKTFKKTETFVGDCDTDVAEILIESLFHECIDDKFENNCKLIDG